MLEVLCNLALSEQDTTGVEDQRSFGTGVLLSERDLLIGQLQTLCTNLNVLDDATWRHHDAHESWRRWVARELLAVLMVAPETGFSIKALLAELPWLESIAPVPMQGGMTSAKWYELVESALVVGFWLPVLEGAKGRRLRVDVAVAREEKTIPDWLETPTTLAVLQESRARANMVLCASGMSRPWTVHMDQRLPPVVDRSASLGLALAV